MPQISQRTDFDMPGRYARALFMLAEENNQLDVVAENIQTLKKMITDVPELKQALATIAGGQNIWTRAIQPIMVRAGLNEITQNFVGVVLEKNRGSEILAIVRAFEALYDAHQAIMQVDIITAIHPSEMQTQKLRQLCQNHFGENTKIKFHIDETIIGGVRLNLPDRTLDASLAGKLSQLEGQFRAYFQTA